MIDSTPIMKDYADIESSKLPEYQIDSKIPEGPLAEKWTNYKAHQKLVNPANKRNLDVIVVGTGLAGASAASTLGELGFNVLNFCIQDSPRRAHSIAAQGGINAARTSGQRRRLCISRLFYDTSRATSAPANAIVWRGIGTSSDQCVAQGVPFAANTAVCWPTVRSAAHRYRVHSMPKARQASSFSSALTLRSTARSRKAL